MRPLARENLGYLFEKMMQLIVLHGCQARDLPFHLEAEW